MEIGLSHETVQMIKEQLGPQWAKVTVWAVTLAIIISPLVLTVTLVGLGASLLLVTWGWAANQLSRALGLSLAVVLVGTFGSCALYLGVTQFLKPKAKLLVEEAGRILEEAQACIDEMHEISRDTQFIQKTIDGMLKDKEAEGKGSFPC